jgi:hypothetical protein
VTGNTARIVQAVIRAIVAGMLATIGAGLLLAIGGALSDLGRITLDASGAGVDAPLVPLQEVLMDTAEQRESGAELFIAFLAGLVIVFTSLAIYFTLAMRPVLLAAVIVFLPVAHALSVWTPMRRVELRTWALAFAVLLADAAIMTMFAVTNTVIGQPQGVDRLIFGTFGLLLAALAPAALARIIGIPELQTAVQSMTRGSRVVAAGAGIVAAKGALLAAATGRSATGVATSGGAGGAGAAGAAGSALDGPGPAGGGGGVGGAPGGTGDGGPRGGASAGAAAGGTSTASAGRTASTSSTPATGSPASGGAPRAEAPSAAGTTTGVTAGGSTVVATSSGSPRSEPFESSAPVDPSGVGPSSTPTGAAPVPAVTSTTAPAPGLQASPPPASGGWGSALTRQPAGVDRG